MKPEHIRQAVGYGSNKGSDWVILTNGDHWMIFKIVFEKPVSYELIYDFTFLNLNYKNETHLEFLYYISKESIGRSALEEFLIERQTLSKYCIGQIIISDPVLDSIRRTLKKVCKDVKVTNEDIKSALIDEVLRRDIFDNDKSEEARKRITKALK